MFFNNKKKENNKTKSEAPAFDFEKFMEQLRDDEAKRLDSMTEAEIRMYAADTRVHLTHAYGLLTISANALTSLQQSQLTIIDAVNKIIDKKEVATINVHTILGIDKTMEEIKKMADKNVC